MAHPANGVGHLLSSILSFSGDTPIRGKELERWPLILSMGLRVHPPVLSDSFLSIYIPRPLIFVLSPRPLLYRLDTTFSIQPLIFNPSPGAYSYIHPT